MQVIKPRIYPGYLYNQAPVSACQLSSTQYLPRTLISTIMLFACSLLFLLVAPLSAEELDAETAYLLSTKHQLVIVDIRRASEWRKTGLPATSHGISLQNFLKKVRGDFANDIAQLVEGDLDRPIALICATGGRSTYALDILRNAGFSSVYNVREGMFGNGALPGWLARNLPIRQCDDC